MEEEGACKVCGSHEHETGNCPPPATGGGAGKDVPIEAFVEIKKPVDFTQILEDLRFIPDKNNDEGFIRERAETTFKYNGVEIGLTAVCEHHTPIKDISVTFALKFKDRSLLIADIYAMAYDQHWSPATDKRTSVTCTNVGRVGTKRNFPKKLGGIGIAFYEGLLHYNQVFAQKMKQDLIHRVRPTPLAGETTDWNLETQENWDKKFKPLLDRQGYVERKIAAITDPNDADSQVEVYEEELLPKTIIFQQKQVFEKKYLYKPKTSEELK